MVLSTGVKSRKVLTVNLNVFDFLELVSSLQLPQDAFLKILLVSILYTLSSDFFFLCMDGSSYNLILVDSGLDFNFVVHCTFGHQFVSGFILMQRLVSAISTLFLRYVSYLY